MEHYLIEKGYIPLDKSWMIRMGVLDMIHGYHDSARFLEQNYLGLSDDLQALYHASLDWNSKDAVNAGESGTLYRFLKFASWKLGKKKRFHLQGTLQGRKICNDSSIIGYSIDKLLKLDNRTSQWASASVLLGNEQRIENPPFKLQVTYDAVNHWKERREKRECWEPRYDNTILRQAEAYLAMLHDFSMHFEAEQAEDYCFARAFGFMDSKEGNEKWPSLIGHESNRISEMEKMLELAASGKPIDSKDHRVVQAVAMLCRLNNKAARLEFPKAVNKSWPQFWKFLNDAPYL